jgi:uncharacterized RDD family membrane protein YckC
MLILSTPAGQLPRNTRGVPCLFVLAIGLLMPVHPVVGEGIGLKAAGGDNSLYVTLEANGEHGLETRIWMRQIDQGFRRPKRTDQQPAGIIAAAACGNYLHVFWENGTHRRVGPHGSTVQLVLPGRAKPLCLAGDTHDEVLYAIIESEDDESESAPSTSSGEPAAGPSRTPGSSPPSATGPASRRSTTAISPRERVMTSRQAPAPRSEVAAVLSMYRFYRGQWSRVGSAPASFRVDDGHVMCASGGQVHLFEWSAEDAESVRYVRWSDQKWGSAQTVAVPAGSIPVASMVLNFKLVLVTVSSPAAGRPVVTSVWHDGKQWHQTELRMPADVVLDPSPDHLRVASYRESIALVGQLGKKGVLQVGLWSPTSGTAKEPPRTLPRWPERRPASMQPRLPQIVIFAILGGVIALTLWWRQESISTPIPLPANFELATLGRRLAAGLIDIGPAIAITSVYWVPLLLQVRREVLQEEVPDAEVAVRYGVLLWPWLCIRVLYAVTCILSEYRWGTTLGKRLMQIYVVSSDLTRPSPKQVLIRNAVKVIELEPDLAALLVFVLLTRNRQRLGDVLAGTTLVQMKASIEA